jgi:type IV pilus assembly protein PilX
MSQINMSQANPMTRCFNPALPGRQQGISLLVVLVLLLAMSVLGIAVLRSAAMQERMSANMYDRSLATQATENAIVAARDWLSTGSGVDWSVKRPMVTAVTPDDVVGACATYSVCPWYTTQAGTTWKAGPTLGAADPDVPDTTTQYWIEYLGENQSHLTSGGVVPASATSSLGPTYRITARSQAEGRASVTLQSDFIYRFPTL